MKKLLGSIIVAILIFTSVFLVSANHSFAIYNAEICMNGARFEASSSTPESFRLDMVGQIFNSNYKLVASGGFYNFADYETVTFTVVYPVGTFSVGDLIIYSVSDIPNELNGNEGAYEYAYVQDCMLSFDTISLDNRINRFDSASPIAVYFVNGQIEIWSIDSSSNGTLVMTISQTEIEAAGAGLLSSSGNIFFYKLDDGGYLLRAGMYNGKTYVLSFSELVANAPYTSSEE